MGIPSTLLSFLYPPPPSVYITAMTVINFAAMGNAGLRETRGRNMQYSKFSTSSSSSSSSSYGSSAAAMNKAKISSKSGMVILYTPAAFLAALASFWMFPDEDSRFHFVSAALAIHFFKRVFEVLFVHKYSGSMDVEATIAISLSYLTATANMIYAQHLTHGFPEPQVDLKTVGAGIFLIGILGNFYHHYLLSSLRTKGEKQYKIPQGGLFNLVVCPHYLFEVLGFVGISCISQTWYAFMFTLATTLYLMGRSVATRRWYHSKFEHFPKDRKAIIPYLL